MKLWKIILSLLTATFFIWLILQSIDCDLLANILKKVEVKFILVAVIFFLFGCFCRTYRWRLLLLHKNHKLHLSKCAGPLMASIAINNLLPIRLGDILRAFVFKKNLAVDHGTLLFSIFMERIIDFIVILMMLGLCLSFFEKNHFFPYLIGWKMMMFIALIGIMTLFFSKTLFKASLLLLFKLIFLLNKKLGFQIKYYMKKVLNITSPVMHNRLIFNVLIWSVAIWVLEGLVYFCVALSINSLSNQIAAWVAMPVGTLSTVLPSGPGYAGTFDYITSQTMFFMGNSYESSVAFALLVHLVMWVPSTIIGGAYLLYIKLSKSSGV